MYVHTNTANKTIATSAAASSISFSLRAVCLDAIEETYKTLLFPPIRKKEKNFIPFIVVNPTR
jgi:hypothetical protein